MYIQPGHTLAGRPYCVPRGFHRTYVGQIERGEKNLSFWEPGQTLDVLGVTPSQLLSVLDGDDVPHREPGRKQEAGTTKATQSAQRVREIQKLLKRLKHQRDAMDQTLSLLEEFAVARSESASSRVRANKRRASRIKK